MKKFIFGGLAIATIAAGGFLLSESRTQAYDLTPAQLSNLDALTDGESTGDCGWHYEGLNSHGLQEYHCIVTGRGSAIVVTLILSINNSTESERSM